MRVEELNAHQNSVSIIEDIYNLDFPKDEQFMLRSQMVRAGHSILLNICEGYAFKNKQRSHFYRIALGSAYESKACCLIYEKRMSKKIPELYIKIDKECAMLNGMIKSCSTPDSDSESDSGIF
jgi:four helix bundle protein